MQTDMMERVSVPGFSEARRRREIDSFEFSTIEIITVNLSFVSRGNKVLNLINSRIITINYFNLFIRLDNSFLVNFTVQIFISINS